MKCTQCGSDKDQMLGFTKYPVCLDCIKKNHRMAVNFAKKYKDKHAYKKYPKFTRDITK